MTKLTLLLLALMLSSCATDASRAYDQARYEANPNYQTDDINPAYSYTPKDRSGNAVDYFACIFRYSQRYSQSDSRYICSE